MDGDGWRGNMETKEKNDRREQTDEGKVAMQQHNETQHHENKIK